MNIALFGGTFDPIHRGHLKVARAAAERFKLKEVWFVPADIPPHKQTAPVTSYFHRYSMVALALAGEADFLPSLLEAPDAEAHVERRPSYSIDTVRRVKAGLSKSDRLYFLIGIDAFQDIAQWYEAEALLEECEFIVAARPGYSLDDVASSLPRALRPRAAELREFRKSKPRGPLQLQGVTVHLLPETHEDVSATQIRAAMQNRKGLNKLVPDAVAEYIRKEGLYRGTVETKPKRKIGRGGSEVKRPTQAKPA
jgi:nicotinate-nucleotide adenylyltransferase